MEFSRSSLNYLPAAGRQIPKITYGGGAVMLRHFWGGVESKIDFVKVRLGG